MLAQSFRNNIMHILSAYINIIVIFVLCATDLLQPPQTFCVILVNMHILNMTLM